MPHCIHISIAHTYFITARHIRLDYVSKFFGKLELYTSSGVCFGPFDAISAYDIVSGTIR